MKISRLASCLAIVSVLVITVSMSGFSDMNVVVSLTSLVNCVGYVVMEFFMLKYEYITFHILLELEES